MTNFFVNVPWQKKKNILSWQFTECKLGCIFQVSTQNSHVIRAAKSRQYILKLTMATMGLKLPSHFYRYKMTEAKWSSCKDVKYMNLPCQLFLFPFRGAHFYLQLAMCSRTNHRLAAYKKCCSNMQWQDTKTLANLYPVVDTS